MIFSVRQPESSGWRTEKIIPDYAGIERVVVLRRDEQEADHHENTVL
jgi:hypothetical protein